MRDAGGGQPDRRQRPPAAPGRTGGRSPRRRARPQGRRRQGVGGALRPPLRPAGPPGDDAGRPLHRTGAPCLPERRRPGGGRRRLDLRDRLLDLVRPPAGRPRRAPGLRRPPSSPRVAPVTRLLVAAGLCLWAGCTLLLGGVRRLSRPSLAERLRPYHPGADGANVETTDARSFTAVLGAASRSWGGRLAALFGAGEDASLRLRRVHSSM